LEVALIGYGYWGKIITSYIKNNPNFKLSKIYSPSLNNNGIYTNDLNSTLSNSSIEAVFICSPINTHFKLAKKSLLESKHVFCEKPLTKSSDNFEKIKNIASERNKVLYTDYTYLNSKSIIKMKELIDEIGEIKNISLSLKQYGKFYDDDNVYEVLASHLLSILFYFFPNKNYKFDFFDYYKKDKKTVKGLILLKCKDFNCELDVSLITPYKERKITIFGEKGILEFDATKEKKVKLYHLYNQELKLNDYFCYDEKNNLEYVVNDFYNKIKKESFNYNLEISKKVTEVLESYRSVNK